VSANSEVSTQRKQINLLKKEIIDLRSKQEMLLIDSKRLLKELEMVKSEKLECQEKLRSLSNNYETSHSKDSATKYKIDEYELKISQYKSDEIRKDEEIKELDNKYKDAATELRMKNTLADSLKQELSFSNNKRGELEIQVQELKSNTFTEGMVSHKLKSENEEISRSLKQSQDKVAILQSTCDNLKEELNSVSLQRDSLEHENNILHTKESKMEIDLMNAKSQVFKLDAKVKAGERALKSLQDDYQRAIRKQDSNESSPSKRNKNNNYTALGNTSFYLQTEDVPNKIATPKMKADLDAPKKYSETKYKQNISTVGDMMKWGSQPNDEMRGHSKYNVTFPSNQKYENNKEQIDTIEAKIFEITNEKKKV